MWIRLFLAIEVCKIHLPSSTEPPKEMRTKTLTHVRILGEALSADTPSLLVFHPMAGCAVRVLHWQLGSVPKLGDSIQLSRKLRSFVASTCVNSRQGKH